MQTDAQTAARRPRHWKQKFDRSAPMVFSRPITFLGERYNSGDPIPEALINNRTKLKLFWESRRVEYRDFNRSTGRKTKPVEEAKPAEGARTVVVAKAVVDGSGDAVISTEGLSSVAPATRDQARDALSAVVASKGKPAAVAIMKSMGYKSLKDVKDGDLGRLVDACQDAMKE